MSEATTGLDNITAKQVKELKQIAPSLIRGAIEDLYKTLFRLLGSLGRKKYKALKKKSV